MTLQILSKFLITAPLALLWWVQNPQSPAKPPAKQPTMAKPGDKKPSTALPPAKPAPATPAEKTAPVAPALPPDTVVLSVGGEKVTKADFEALLDGLPEQARKSAVGPNKRKLAEDLAQLKAMAQEAKRRKLDQSESVRQLMELQQEQVLASTLVKQLQSELKTDDAAVKEWYDAHKAEYENVKASHILIRFKGSNVPLKQGQKELTEEEALTKAQAIRKRLIAGEDFATVAKAESDDAGASANGGSLGAITKGRMVPAFEQAAFTLKPGEVSEPVKTQFGYHIIKVEDHSTKTLEEVRPQIEQQMKPQITQKALEKIRDGAQVVINEQYFGTGPSSATPPTPSTPTPTPKPHEKE
jgi:peptidyl-prolyl cis-trans isomerase C